MKIAICDDERDALDKYHDLIMGIAEKTGQEITIDVYTSGESLLFNMQGAKDVPDGIFLDINMPGIKGIDVAKKLADINVFSNIIFLTQSEDYVFDAFDVRAFNYVVKGEDEGKRLEKIILELEDKAEADNEDFIMLSSCGENVIVPIDKITYFESKARLMVVHYGDKTFEFYSTMRKVEEDLFMKGFVRVHKSFLVAASQIKSFVRYDLTLKNGLTIPIGRNYYTDLKELLNS